MNELTWFEECVYYHNLLAVIISFFMALSKGLENLYGVYSFCFILILLLAQFIFYARKFEKEKNSKKFNPLKFWNPSSRVNSDKCDPDEDAEIE